MVRNYDWVPDEDHGSVAMLALQSMLLQEVGSQILLGPAWPEGWDVSFRLHASGRTVATGEVRSGELASLQVQPGSRHDDVAAMRPTD